MKTIKLVNEVWFKAVWNICLSVYFMEFQVYTCRLLNIGSNNYLYITVFINCFSIIMYMYVEMDSIAHNLYEHKISLVVNA